jgi:hypothetical protein
MTSGLISEGRSEEPRRFPAWIVPILGAAVGWFLKGPVGAVFGAGLGILVWRSRA